MDSLFFAFLLSMAIRFLLDSYGIPSVVYSGCATETQVIEFCCFYFCLLFLFYIALLYTNSSKPNDIRTTILMFVAYIFGHLPFSYFDTYPRAVEFPNPEHFLNNMLTLFIGHGDASYSQIGRMILPALILLWPISKKIGKRLLSLTGVYVIGMLFVHPQAWLYIPSTFHHTTQLELELHTHIAIIYTTYLLILKLLAIIYIKRLVFIEIAVLSACLFLTPRESAMELNLVYLSYLFTINISLDRALYLKHCHPKSALNGLFLLSTMLTSLLLFNQQVSSLSTLCLSFILGSLLLSVRPSALAQKSDHRWIQIFLSSRLFYLFISLTLILTADR